MSNFWKTLIRRIADGGHEVLCLLPVPGPDDDPAWERDLAALGARVEHYPLDRKGLNPFRDFATLWRLRGLFLRERPDVLFAFTIKPVIHGSLASCLAGSPVRRNRHVMITGLGYMFEADSLVKKVLLQVARLLYRLAFSCVGSVYFQNQDDKALFERLSIVGRKTVVRLSKGTGVDVDHFTVQREPEGSPYFLYVGRLLEAKGLRDLAAAARLLQEEFPGARVGLLGPEEQGPGSVSLDEVLSWQQEGLVEYLGSTRDVRPFLARASVVVLPSWREGTPTSLLEAMAVGRALIVTDVPGCREVVRDGVNGLRVPKGDAPALASAMKELILESELRHRMAAASREMAEGEFSADHVARKLMQEMGIPEHPTEKKQVAP